VLISGYPAWSLFAEEAVLAESISSRLLLLLLLLKVQTVQQVLHNAPRQWRCVSTFTDTVGCELAVSGYIEQQSPPCSAMYLADAATARLYGRIPVRSRVSPSTAGVLACLWIGNRLLYAWKRPAKLSNPPKKYPGDSTYIPGIL